jgi:hypothetical protein
MSQDDFDKIEAILPFARSGYSDLSGRAADLVRDSEKSIHALASRLCLYMTQDFLEVGLVVASSRGNADAGRRLRARDRLIHSADLGDQSHTHPVR